MSAKQTGMNLDAISEQEKDILLDHMFYHIKMEERYTLIRKFPHIYNKLCGKDVVTVVFTNNGAPV